MKWLAIFVSGVLFSLGLGIGGMLDPQVVVGFLDVTGTWDPSAALVMAGGFAVNAVAYRLTAPQGQPLFAPRFYLPSSEDISPVFLLGSVLFGVGWGLSGFCPGPALTNLTTGTVDAFAFVAAMGVGSAAAGWVNSLRPAPDVTPVGESCG